MTCDDGVDDLTIQVGTFRRLLLGIPQFTIHTFGGQKLGEHLQNGCHAITEARPVLPLEARKYLAYRDFNTDAGLTDPELCTGFQTLQRLWSSAS